MSDSICKRLSTNEIIDNFKDLMEFKYDRQVSTLLKIPSCIIYTCRHRESSTILFPIMDYLVANNISIEKIFYKVKK